MSRQQKIFFRGFLPTPVSNNLSTKPTTTKYWGGRVAKIEYYLYLAWLEEQEIKNTNK